MIPYGSTATRSRKSRFFENRFCFFLAVKIAFTLCLFLKYDKVMYIDSFYISKQLLDLNLLVKTLICYLIWLIFDMSLSFVPFFDKILYFQPKNSCQAAIGRHIPWYHLKAQRIPYNIQEKSTWGNLGKILECRFCTNLFA